MDLSRAVPGASINIGVVHGGTRSNVVAERAEAEIDLRVDTMAQYEQMVQAMNAIVESVSIPGTRATLRGALDMPPMERTEGINRMFERVQRAGRGLGLELAAVATGGGSDANNAAPFAPVVDGMGPVGSGAHGVGEFVELASLTERAKVLAIFIAEWVAESRV